MVVILFWIIVIAIGVAVAIGLYFFPTITLKILCSIVRVLVIGTFNLVKAIANGITGASKRLKENLAKKRMNKRQNEIDKGESSNNSTVNNVTNVNIGGSRLFTDEDSVPSDLDTRMDESNLIKKDELFTR